MAVFFYYTPISWKMEALPDKNIRFFREKSGRIWFVDGTSLCGDPSVKQSTSHRQKKGDAENRYPYCTEISKQINSQDANTEDCNITEHRKQNGKALLDDLYLIGPLHICEPRAEKQSESAWEDSIKLRNDDNQDKPQRLIPQKQDRCNERGKQRRDAGPQQMKSPLC